ncbi:MULTISPECIES: HNH endonuclease [unclassified Spirosoma]|uniref:HNH endonuclease n=1 Tax=unclassified Spirosoma TaxID=2621999 RepID=UPI000967C9E6|nr:MULTISPECIES: HNH endonuclease [unclassified Spirosoma]MBN8823420.1 HNH endonuclease [Spirosoma sp.]OJW71963.1 MAG: restriction endonuclease [Spirosoma sp. 48-14]
MSIPFDEILLKVYKRKFTKLRQGGTQYGKAPHKPVFLISLLELIDKHIISDNRITITPELVATFKENFALLVNTAHKDDFTQPFFYLQHDGFWFLNARLGYQLDQYIRSVQTLNDRLDYGYFDHSLFDLLMNDAARSDLKRTLLDHYFSDTKAEFWSVKNAGRSYLQDMETYLLNEKEVVYEKLQIKEDEEIRFVRGGLFKKLVPKVYDFTCAISGMKVIAVDGSSLVEACHIVPISISGDDKVTNGISLCPNLHTAFDRGMIGVDEQLRVVVSPLLADNPMSSYNLTQFHRKPLQLPFGKVHYPKIEHFRWHMQERFRR